MAAYPVHDAYVASSPGPCHLSVETYWQTVPQWGKLGVSARRLWRALSICMYIANSALIFPPHASPFSLSPHIHRSQRQRRQSGQSQKYTARTQQARFSPIICNYSLRLPFSQPLRTRLLRTLPSLSCARHLIQSAWVCRIASKQHHSTISPSTQHHTVQYLQRSRDLLRCSNRGPTVFLDYR
jgi:hypothetical protein